MPHKLAVGNFKGVDVAFKADDLLEYFTIDRPYKVPQVGESYGWIQNLRGRIVTHIAWWQVIRQWNLNLFRFTAADEVALTASALLYSVDKTYIGIPVDEIQIIETVDDDQLVSIGETVGEGECPLSWQGRIIIDPKTIFQHVA